MRLDLSRVYDKRINRVSETPVPYVANNPQTTEISRAWPIDRIECILAGTYTVATSSSTLKEGGALNLIDRVNLRSEGKDVLYSVPGRLLQLVSDWYSYGQHSDADIAPGTSVGSHDFELSFTLPINAGPDGFSLFDATRKSQVVLEVLWKDVDDMATPGGTHSLSGTQVQVDTVQWAGGVVGQPGGPGFGYPLHLIDFREISVSAAQSDLLQQLIKTHLYSRVAFFCTNSGSVSNSILNRVSVEMDQSVLQQPRANRLQASNVTRYDLAARETGWYVLDLADAVAPRAPRVPDYLVLNDPSIPFHAKLDVSNPAGTNRIIMVTDHYARPSITRTAA